MRPKVIASVLLLGIGVITLALLVRGLVRAPVGPETTGVTPEIAVGGGSPHSPAPPESANNATVNPLAGGGPPSNSVIARTFEEERAARIRGDLEQISDAVMSGKDDPLAADIILDRITNPEPEVSQAALSAVVYFDTPAAIARLKEIGNQMKDPRNRVAIMDAIELMTPVPDPFEGLTNTAPASLPQEQTAATRSANSKPARPKTLAIPPGAVKAPPPPGR